MSTHERSFISMFVAVSGLQRVKENKFYLTVFWISICLKYGSFCENIFFLNPFSVFFIGSFIFNISTTFVSILLEL